MNITWILQTTLDRLCSSICNICIYLHGYFHQVSAHMIQQSFTYRNSSFEQLSTNCRVSGLIPSLSCPHVEASLSSTLKSSCPQPFTKSIIKLFSNPKINHLWWRQTKQNETVVVSVCARQHWAPPLAHGCIDVTQSHITDILPLSVKPSSECASDSRHPQCLFSSLTSSQK